MRSTTNLSRLTAAARPQVAPGGVLAGRATLNGVARSRAGLEGADGGRIDPEVIERARELESTFDRGSTAYLEDVLPELEELLQLLARQLLRAVSQSERISTWAEASAQPVPPPPRLFRELATLVEEARGRCLGVPNPPGFRGVANRFSLFRVALEAESTEEAVRDRLS